MEKPTDLNADDGLSRWGKIVANTYAALFSDPDDKPDEINYAKVASLFRVISAKQVRQWYLLKDKTPHRSNQELLLALERITEHYEEIKLGLRSAVSGLLMMRPLREMFVQQLPTGMAREVFEKGGFLSEESIRPEDWDMATRGVLVALTRGWLRAIDTDRTNLGVLKVDESRPGVEQEVMEATIDDYFKVVADPTLKAIQLSARMQLAERRMAEATTPKKKAIAEQVIGVVKKEMSEIPTKVRNDIWEAVKPKKQKTSRSNKPKKPSRPRRKKGSR